MDEEIKKDTTKDVVEETTEKKEINAEPAK